MNDRLNVFELENTRRIMVIKQFKGINAIFCYAHAFFPNSYTSQAIKKDTSLALYSSNSYSGIAEA